MKQRVATDTWKSLFQNIQNFDSSKLPFEVKLFSVFGKLYKTWYVENTNLINAFTEFLSRYKQR